MRSAHVRATREGFREENYFPAPLVVEGVRGEASPAYDGRQGSSIAAITAVASLETIATSKNANNNTQNNQISSREDL